MTEIDRLCQVEEEWGRRKAMEPVSNAERLEQYESKKALWRCFPGSETATAKVPTAHVLTFPTRSRT